MYLILIVGLLKMMIGNEKIHFGEFKVGKWPVILAKLAKGLPKF